MSKTSSAPMRVVPLIKCDGEGEYSACDETLDWIRRHKRPFGVITCAGKYRTGKSFLMNRLAECTSTNGFGVGDTVQACTKGLWVCRQFFRISDEMDVLFVDTEGIDALDATDDNDVRIFTLALLLSSVFVYNSVGHIDEAALSTLSLMTRVTESIRQSHEGGGEGAPLSSAEMATQMPSFHWVLRDFSLRMEDKSGKALSADEYLEDALDMSAHSGDETRTATRNAIRDCFDVRHLHTLPRPAAETEMQKLDERPWLITSRFHEAIETLRIALFNSVTPMGCDGVSMTGNVYAELCAFMCKHGKSKLPVMRDTWALMTSIHARDLKDELCAKFVATIEEWEPSEKTVLVAHAQNEMNDVMSEFQTRSMQPVDVGVKQALLQTLQQASTQRISVIGFDYEQLAAKEREALQKRLASSTTTAVDVVRLLVASYNDFQYDKHIWMRCIGEHLFATWLPDLCERLESERQALEGDVSHKLNAARLDAAAIEAQLRETIRTNECTLEEERANVVSKAEEVEHERGEAEAARQLVAELRLKVAALTTEVETLRLSPSGGESDGGETAPTATYDDQRCAHADKMVNDATRSRADTLAKLDTLQSEYNQLEERLGDAKGKLDASLAREATLNASWTAGLDTIKAEARECKRKDDISIQRLTSEVDALGAKIRNQATQLEQATRTEERMVEDHSREIRQMSDMMDRSRETADQAQHRVVDMHKSMLMDLKTRDERVREMHTKYATEQAEYQSKYTESVRQGELKNVELLGLKRRLDDMSQYEDECKRLRVQVQDNVTQLTRHESESTGTQRRLESVSTERDEARTRVMTLENELAILRAEKQLLDARNAIAE